MTLLELITASAQQLHDAQVWTDMPAVFRQFCYQFVANFFGQRLQLVQRQFLDVGWVINHIEITAHRS